MKKVADYDEAEVLRQLPDRFWTWYLSEFENRVFHFGARKAHAEKLNQEWFTQRVDSEFERLATPEVRAALADGYEAFHQRVKDRIFKQLQNGPIPVNRCPSCQRIALTPKARQRCWCGHDWH